MLRSLWGWELCRGSEEPLQEWDEVGGCGDLGLRGAGQSGLGAAGTAAQGRGPGLCGELAPALPLALLPVRRCLASGFRGICTTPVPAQRASIAGTTASHGQGLPIAKE